jgi:putative addiction module component (TIGR02574 family)
MVGEPEEKQPALFRTIAYDTNQVCGGPPMSERSASLLAATLQLSQEERAEPVEGLVDSLDSPDSEVDRMTEEEFAAELERRADELRQNPDAGIPWDQVKDMR